MLRAGADYTLLKGGRKGGEWYENIENLNMHIFITMARVLTIKYTMERGGLDDPNGRRTMANGRVSTEIRLNHSWADCRGGGGHHHKLLLQADTEGRRGIQETSGGTKLLIPIASYRLNTC